jgi:glycogen synthase kinase 3 beta
MNVKRLGKIDAGTFGVICKVELTDTKEICAMKTVKIDPRHIQRELEMTKLASAEGHPNIVGLRRHFHSHDESGSTLLNMVLEYVSTNLRRYIRSYTKNKQHMPRERRNRIMSQATAGMEHLHKLGITHRDLKPENILVCPETDRVKICDFGNAKMLQPGEKSITYIVSRYYRAPELVLGMAKYNNKVDIWALGCVYGEMLLGTPLFPGKTNMDQFLCIVMQLGTPSNESLKAFGLDENYLTVQRSRKSWAEMGLHTCEEDEVLLDAILCYTPSSRPSCEDILKFPALSNISSNTASACSTPLITQDVSSAEDHD